MSKHKKLTQTQSGKAWEYAIALELSTLLKIPIVNNKPKLTAQNAHKKMSKIECANATKAASEVIKFLLKFEGQLRKNPKRIIMQSDAHGKNADVRDIVVNTDSGNVGISAKHRHADLKHPRLSPTIDFALDWIGNPVTSEYWKNIGPIFSKLDKTSVEKWREFPNKEDEIYVPILKTFVAEIKRQCSMHKTKTAHAFMNYMIGQYDFYKIMKENGTVCIQSFNMNKTLEWGKQTTLPTEIISVDIKYKSQTTAFVVFNKGWSLELRIHNAETKLTPSLKFAVKLIGQPTKLATHTITYKQKQKIPVSL